MYTYLDEVTSQDERAWNILFVYTAILDPNLDLGVEIIQIEIQPTLLDTNIDLGEEIIQIDIQPTLLDPNLDLGVEII